MMTKNELYIDLVERAGRRYRIAQNVEKTTDFVSGAVWTAVQFGVVDRKEMVEFKREILAEVTGCE